MSEPLNRFLSFNGLKTKQKTSKPKTTKATSKQAFDGDNKKIPVTAGRLEWAVRSQVRSAALSVVVGENFGTRGVIMEL